MKSYLTPGIAALAGLLMVSCYPMPESRHIRNEPRPEDQAVTSSQQQTIKDQREKMKERDKRIAQQEDEQNDRPTPTKERETTPDSTPKPPAKTTKDYVFAQPIPGKEGFVLSPYNGKQIDVRDIPSGTLVQDPTYPSSEKKYFRVP